MIMWSFRSFLEIHIPVKLYTSKIILDFYSCFFPVHADVDEESVVVFHVGNEMWLGFWLRKGSEIALRSWLWQVALWAHLLNLNLTTSLLCDLMSSNLHSLMKSLFSPSYLLLNIIGGQLFQTTFFVLCFWCYTYGEGMGVEAVYTWTCYKGWWNMQTWYSS